LAATEQQNGDGLDTARSTSLRADSLAATEQQNGDELPGTRCRPAAHLILVRFHGLGRCIQVGRRFRSIYRGILLPSLKELWLAVDEVVHHDDVIVAIVIRPRGNVAGFDPDPRDARVVKHDAEEGQAPVSRRGRDETAEYHPAELIEVLDQRAGPAISALRARPATIWLIHVCEDCAEGADRCRVGAISTRYEEHSVGDVAAHRREQPRRAKGAEDVAVGGIIEERGQPALWPARRRSLRKAQPGCGELAAPRVQEHVERRYRGCGIQNVWIATVPVDLAATALEWPRVIAVVGVSHSSAERIDRTLNRGSA
jgi:hypothetical protein